MNILLQYSSSRPETHTVFGSGKEFDALPQETQDQIIFLNDEASKFVNDYFSIARLITGGGWDPFSAGNFKTVENFNHFYHGDESRAALKKWLYNRGIPFRNWVFLLQNNDNAIMCTWKMILRYSPFIFYGDDVAVFDTSINWCLFYYHENDMFFGKHRKYDVAENERMMNELNERKEKYPQFKHPYL